MRGGRQTRGSVGFGPSSEERPEKIEIYWMGHIRPREGMEDNENIDKPAKRLRRAEENIFEATTSRVPPKTSPKSSPQRGNLNTFSEVRWATKHSSWQNPGGSTMDQTSGQQEVV